MGNLLQQVINYLQKVDAKTSNKTEDNSTAMSIDQNKLIEIKSRLQSVRNNISNDKSDVSDPRHGLIEMNRLISSSGGMFSPVQQSLFENVTNGNNTQSEMFSGRSSSKKINNFVRRLSANKPQPASAMSSERMVKGGKISDLEL